ncbi:MAG: hypothetical protein ABIN58_00715 [candidate division WOR-3 bacterium]
MLVSAFRLNSDTGLLGSAYQGEVVSARAQNGSVVVAWEDWRNGNADIYFSLFGPSGAPVVQDVRANRDSTLGDQISPSVAFGPGVFAIAWEDTRTTYPKVWFRLFDANTGNPIFKAYKVDEYYENDVQRNPMCAWADSLLWIMWEDERIGTEAIHGRMFYINGAPASFVIDVSADTNKNHANPWAAAADSTVMVAWQSLRNDTTIDAYYRVFRADGSPVGSPYWLTPVSTEQTYPVVVRWSGGFVAFWFDDAAVNPKVVGQLFTEFGSSIAPSQVVVPGSPGRTRLWAIGIGDTFALAWLENNQVMWAMTDINLGLLAGPARLDDSPGLVSSFSVVADGLGLSAYWTDNRRGDTDVYTTGGKRLNAEEPPQWTPSVSALGGTCLAAWTDYRNDPGQRENPDVYARLFTGSGPRGNDFLIPTTASGKEIYPSVAATGDSFLVVWQDNRGGTYQIYGRFLDTLGNFLGGDFSLRLSSDFQTRPSVSDIPGGYVAVWEELGSDWAIKGILKPSDVGLTISSAGDVYQPRVSALPDGRFCVVWVQTGSAYARFYAANGFPLTLPIRVSESNHQVFDVAVGATDSLFTIAWEDISHIYARTYRPNGQAASPMITPTTWERYQQRPAVATFGDSIAIAWDGWIDHPGLYIRQYNSNVGNPAGGFAEMGEPGALPKQSYAMGLVGLQDGVAAVWCDWRDSKGSDIYAETKAWDFVNVDEERVKAWGFSLLGSPVRDYLRIRIASPGEHILSIYDATGRRLKETRLEGPGDRTIPVSELGSGVYIIVSDGGWRESFAIIR